MTKINFYLDNETGEVLAICEECFRAETLADFMVNLTCIDSAGQADICNYCAIPRRVLNLLPKLSTENKEIKMRVKEVQFCGDSVEGLEEVLAAFCKPFPSLASLLDNAAALLNFLYTAGTESGEEIQAGLDTDSFSGEWPGNVFLSIKRFPLRELVEELVIQPYVGDRVLIIRDTRDAPIWADWIAVCDYTARPSEQAAQDVVKLASRTRRGGDGTALVDLNNPVRYSD